MLRAATSLLDLSYNNISNIKDVKDDMPPIQGHLYTNSSPVKIPELNTPEKGFESCQPEHRNEENN